MYEQRLMAIGFPFSDAFSVCRSLGKDLFNVEEFVKEQEELAKQNKEVMR